MHLGFVVPLPPTPAGAADYFAASLPLLSRHVEVSCFVPDPEAVSPALRETYRIRPVEERYDPDVDMLIYHIGNNPHHAFVFNALMEGPAGLVEVHDGSMHHYLQGVSLGNADIFAYSAFGEEAHGYAGKRLTEMRTRRYRGTIELFLYDFLQPAVDRSRGVIVHSDYAEHLVQLRSPRVHSWLVPLAAPEFPTPDPDRSWTGVDSSTLLITNLGFITKPKRSILNLQALRMILDRGLDAHMAFVGRDEMRGELQKEIKRLDLTGKVTITGYVDNDAMQRWTQASDVIVNLRAPHVGESSGSLVFGMAAGKPVVVQPVGSWADLPEEAVVRLPVTDDDASALARTLFALGQDRQLRERYGDRAREYARTELNADTCAERLAQAATEALERAWVPPAWFSPVRITAVKTLLDSGSARIEKLLAEDTNVPATHTHAALERVHPARPGGRLLAIDAPPRLIQLLANTWGYEIEACTTGDVKTYSLGDLITIPAYTYTTVPFEDQLDALEEYDVIIASDLMGRHVDLLARANRALTPQGTIIVLNDVVPVSTLNDAGFSEHMHLDHPTWRGQRSHEQDITLGVKATMPLFVPN